MALNAPRFGVVGHASTVYLAGFLVWCDTFCIMEGHLPAWKVPCIYSVHIIKSTKDRKKGYAFNNQMCLINRVRLTAILC